MRIHFTIVALAAAVVDAGIYPDDHFDVSKKLTVDNFDATVQAEIDAGKTMFAPAWNRVVQAFKDNKDVAFGDINLSEQQIRGNHNPGAGGWPTIRYFNKETGLEGGTYVKKTDNAMCEELGKDDIMQAYVEEYGSTSLCSAETNAGCGEREVEYITKMKGKDSEELVKQLRRLQGMDGSSMKPDLKAWMQKRIAILKQLTPTDDDQAKFNRPQL